MAWGNDIAIVGVLSAVACNGSAAVVVEGHDASTLDAGTADGEVPDDASAFDALNETAAAYCAMYFDASDPSAVCGARNCCSQLFACTFGQACENFYGCEVDTPLDAAPPDAGDPEQWLIDYCTEQYPEGGAQAQAGRKAGAGAGVDGGAVVLC